ncbi:hypothetical protein PVAP13_9NG117373 [Panicum virgatum]|uniref:Uncharacterized protein n=1 Tax=Panicum virgatum TaxID=38727 RepID=A0A8T0MKR9_PANVG|nr:hypothetical protein PVAP13_9NG117373 [Panicum virgatum]
MYRRRPPHRQPLLIRARLTGGHGLLVDSTTPARCLSPTYRLLLSVFFEAPPPPVRHTHPIRHRCHRSTSPTPPVHRLLQPSDTGVPDSAVPAAPVRPWLRPLLPAPHPVLCSGEAMAAKPLVPRSSTPHGPSGDQGSAGDGDEDPFRPVKHFGAEAGNADRGSGRGQGSLPQPRPAPLPP